MTLNALYGKQISLSYLEQDHNPIFPMDDNSVFVSHQDKFRKIIHEFSRHPQSSANKSAQNDKQLA